MVRVAFARGGGKDDSLLDGTVAALRAGLPEPEIQAGLAAVRKDAAFAETLRPLCRVVVARLDPEDIALAGKFWAALLRFGDARAKIPLYAIAAWVLEDAPTAAPAFAEFAAIVRTDERTLRTDLREEFLSRAGDFEFTEEPAAFPVLRLMERIVVVDVPHLYEVDALGERTSLCEDLNSFVPIAPLDERLAENERVKIICETMETVDLPPFRTWARLTSEGSMFMGEDRGADKSVDLEILEGVRLEIPEFTANEEGEEQDHAEEDAPEVETVASPMDFVIIGADVFLPSMDVVNTTGQEFFEQITAEAEAEAEAM
jgi:hypothetical protein